MFEMWMIMKCRTQVRLYASRKAKESDFDETRNQ